MINIYIEEDDKKSRSAFQLIFEILGYTYKIFSGIRVKPIDFGIIFFYGRDLESFSRGVEGKPVVFIPAGKRKERLNYSQKGLNFVFSYDLIAETFSIVSREEEAGSEKDEHKRQLATNSSIFSQLENPRINLSIMLIDKCIREVCRKNNLLLIRKAYWPGGRQFAAFLSHDVDVPFKYGFLGTLTGIKAATKAMLKMNFVGCAKGLKEYILGFISRKNPYWQFQNVASLESEYQFKSTFFFCPKKLHRLDPNYSVFDNKIKVIMRNLDSNGFEVGLHCSYMAYNDLGLFIRQKKQLENAIGKTVYGNRSHFLRFDLDNTFTLEEKSGILYDSTIGYSQNIGYRSGISFPYSPLMADGGVIQGTLEIPLAVMDAALFNSANDEKDAWARLKALLLRVQQHGGIIVLDWHQRVFYQDEFKGYAEVYRRCLDFLKINRAYVATGKEIADWWNQRKSVKITTINSKRNTIFEIEPIENILNLCFELINLQTDRISIENNKYYKLIKEGNTISILFKSIHPNDKLRITVRR